MREGTEDFLSEQRRWFQLNRHRLAAECAAITKKTKDINPALENPFLVHQDQTAYDSVFAHAIFTPLLSKALAASARLGYPIRRPIVLANAPSVEPTPAGVPSTDCHMLFIGQGTSSFCNYWAKIFSAAIYKAGTVPAQDRCETSIIAAIRSDPVMLQALKLVLKYARSESLMGFGELKQEPHLAPFRLLLVAAMETFIIGHELGHFFLHEQYPELNGVPPNHTLLDVELLCDAIGFAICSAVGDTEENEVSRHLIGPLLLLYALKLSEDAKGILLDLKPQASDTHPGLTERIQGLFKFANTADPSSSLVTTMEEALNYALIVGVHIKTVLKSVRADESNDG